MTLLSMAHDASLRARIAALILSIVGCKVLSFSAKKIDRPFCAAPQSTVHTVCSWYMDVDSMVQHLHHKRATGRAKGS